MDGVRLDTLAYNVTKITRQTAARRNRDQVAPGVDGLVVSYHDSLEPAQFALEMWVRGTDVDGVTPAVGQQTQLQNNLDELVHLFGKRHALLDVQEQVDGTGTIRRAWCKMSDAIVPELNDVSTVAKFTVLLSVVYGTWEDLATQDWVGTLGGATAQGAALVAQEVTTLQGATERATDTIILVAGPIEWPMVTDVNTGAMVFLQRELLGGEFWRVNCRTWATRYGTGLTLGSADTAGTNAGTLTQQAGFPVGGGPFLTLTPVRDTGLRRVKVALSENGTPTRYNPAGPTRLSMRTLRRFAL